MDTISMKKGEVLFKQGDASNGLMYEILRGEVGIYTEKNGSDHLLTTLIPGDSFGELALLNNIPRTATVKAMSNDVVLRPLEMEGLRGYYKKSPVKLYMMLQNLSHRIRVVSDDYVEASNAIAEYKATKDKGEPISDSLNEKLKKINRKVNRK